MSLVNVKNYFKKYNMENNIIELTSSSATVLMAAEALGTKPERIAKTIGFMINETPILIVMAGDVKIDNSKYKNYFKTKAKMIDTSLVDEVIGHPVGGVCPFAIKDNIKVYLDESLKRFETVFPACGSPNSAIELSIKNLEKYACSSNWIDVSKSIINENNL
ncbi:MAG: YbaK/EbsC family protein [Bacilli bacterium]|nr:YbaK/EbsC family protein [Bacilli bacterium]